MILVSSVLNFQLLTFANHKKPRMEKHIQVFINIISVITAIVATLLLFSILLRGSETCPLLSPHNALKFPGSTCDAFHRPRPFSTIEKKNHRLWSTSAWLKRVQSFSNFFLDAQKHHFLHNSSKSLCLLAGAGQEAMALQQIGVSDVTAVDLVDSPPLVSRADPYNLPFFDEAFDFVFSAQFDVVLFPTRFIAELERTVRVGGFCLLIVEECTYKEVREISWLFKRGELVDADNFTFSGSKTSMIAVRINNPTSK